MSINGKNTTRLYYNKSSNIFDVSNVNLYDLIPTESGYSAYKYSFSKKSFSEILSCEKQWNTFRYQRSEWTAGISDASLWHYAQKCGSGERMV